MFNDYHEDTDKIFCLKSQKEIPMVFSYELKMNCVEGVPEWCELTCHVITYNFRGIKEHNPKRMDSCNRTGEQHKFLSCPNTITTGDYCSECSDTPNGRQPEDDKIREAFEEDHGISSFVKWSLDKEEYTKTDDAMECHLYWVKVAKYGLRSFSIGYTSAMKQSEAEIAEWKDEYKRVDSEKDDLLLLLSEKDKQIESMKREIQKLKNPKPYNPQVDI